MLRGEPFLLASKIETTRRMIIRRIFSISDYSENQKKKEENIEKKKQVFEKDILKKDDKNPQIGCLDSNSGDDNIVCE
jgi:hypothetical protein